jgi:hypothetical protein
MFKVDIQKWLAKEVHATELALLRAEDELANAQLRVNALRERAARLRGKQEGLPVLDFGKRSAALDAYDRAREAFDGAFARAVTE